MILLFIFGLGIGLAYISYILFFGMIGLGVNKLAPKEKTSLDYLDEQIGTTKREELCKQLVEENCNCSFEYDIKQKYFDIEVLKPENKEKVYEILIENGVKNFRIV